MENIVQRAAKFSEEKHRGQIRKVTGLPYIIHPSAVAWLVKYYKKSNNMDILVACALLHDTVEDCFVKIEEIEIIFGTMVAEIVSELTNDKSITDKNMAIEAMKIKLIDISSYSLTIKLCDILHNMIDCEINTAFQIQFYNKIKIYAEHLRKYRKLTPTQEIIMLEIERKLSV